jgi:hypothetical protein
MNKYLVINGGCRGEIDDVQFAESSLPLAELMASCDATAKTDVLEMVDYDEEEANALIEDFAIGAVQINETDFGVCFGEESYEYWILVTEANEEACIRFEASDESRMSEAEDLFGLVL